jgi:hypothetical protein
MIIGIQYAPILSISEEYMADSVKVTVMWTQAQQLHCQVTYFPEVAPFVPIIFTGSTSRQLIIQYNVNYNLSITAATPCRPNATTTRILKYGENNPSTRIPLK